MTRKDKIISLYKRGKTYQQIGDKFGVSRQRIHQIITNYTSPSALASGIITKHFFLNKKEVESFLFNRAKENQINFVFPKNITQFTGLGSGSRERIRELIRMRDKHICQWCGKIWKIKERNFDIHHINGTNKDTRKCDRNYLNQITLCHLCHFKIDGYKMIKD